MAITKTTEVSNISIVVREPTNTSALSLTLVDTWDDPEDPSLPIKKARRVNIERGADVTVYPFFVQDVANFIWR
jgi:hypothetical protein